MQNKKKIGCGGAIVIVLFIAVMVSVLSSKNGSTSSKTATPRETKSVAEVKAKPKESEKPEDSPDQEQKSEQTPKPTEEITKVLTYGETAQVGELEFTLKQMIFSYYCGNLQGFNSIDNDYRHCVVYFDVANPTNDTVTLRTDILGLTGITDWDFDLIFDGEVVYDHTFGKYTEFIFGNDEMLPRATLTNKVVSFKVPVGVANSTDSLEVKLSKNGNDVTIWKLR